MQNALQQVDTKSLVYKKENWLLGIHIVLSLSVWIGLIIVSKGVILIYLIFFFLLYIFAQSAFVSSIKGNGVKLSKEQYPEIYSRYAYCCELLGFSYPPDVYVVNSNGVINAFATRFFARDFVVLNSNAIDAFQSKPDSINFFIGHELGHIYRRHLLWKPLIWPSIFLPLIGSGYFRACEYTCDQFGRACCKDIDTALKGLVSLACGERLWSTTNLPEYADQARETGAFWMSFHELISDYPWLVKRFCRVENQTYSSPDRNPLAWIFAAFCIRVGGGALASLSSMMLVLMLAGSFYALKFFEKGSPARSSSFIQQFDEKTARVGAIEPHASSAQGFTEFNGQLDAPTRDPRVGSAQAETGPVFVPLGENFTVNLQREVGDLYLQTGITVKLPDAETARRVSNNQFSIRAKILFLLSSKKPSELQTAHGKRKLTQELIALINADIGTNSVMDILFTSFIIQ